MGAPHSLQQQSRRLPSEPEGGNALYLNILGPSAAGELTLCLQFRKLRCVVGICAHPYSSVSSASVPAAMWKGAVPFVSARQGRPKAWDRGHTSDAARPEAVSNGKGDVILRANVQDLVPVHVGKVLSVVQQAQLHNHRTVLHCANMCQKANGALIMSADRAGLIIASLF